MALFLHEDSRLLLPAARHIWDQILSHDTEVVRHIQGAEVHYAFARLREAAETQGQRIYDELVLAHRDYCAIVGHGGITLEDVVVPFMRIERYGI